MTEGVGFLPMAFTDLPGRRIREWQSVSAPINQHRPARFMVHGRDHVMGGRELGE